MRSAYAARIWAWIALAGAAGVPATLLVLLVGDLGALVPALLALALAGAALWIAATRRGIKRLLALVGVVAALAGGAAVLVRRGAVNELVAFGAAIALFAAAGRVALRRARSGQAAAAAWPPAPTPQPGRAVLLINPKSGGGKAERFDLPDQARKRGVEPILLEPGDDLLELAERAVSDGAEVIGMAGGDGSQGLVAAVAMRHDIAHVCIPAGTRNHFALDLGLDRDDVVAALDAFTDGVERRVDLARVNDRIFVNNASLGVYARVIQSDAYRDAKLETWAEMLPELLGPDAAPIDLEFDGPNATTYADAPLILVSNNAYQLSHLLGAGTRPRIDGGQLGIVAARIRSASDVAELITLEAIGQTQRFHGLLQWSQSTFEIHSSSTVAVGLDGEALMLEPPLQFESLPGALRIRVPRHAAGVSSAAAVVTFTPAGLRALFGIAMGRPIGAPTRT